MRKNKEDTKRYFRKWYYANKEKQYENVKKRQKEINGWLQNLKKEMKCNKCGENHIACLDFHHKDPNEKEATISQIVLKKGWSKKRILKEIEKCEVLCSNCHRKLHYEEKQPL